MTNGTVSMVTVQLGIIQEDLHTSCHRLDERQVSCDISEPNGTIDMQKKGCRSAGMARKVTNP